MSNGMLSWQVPRQLPWRLQRIKLAIAEYQIRLLSRGQLWDASSGMFTKGIPVVIFRRQLLLALAEWLCANHAADERAKRIVEDLHLFILPSMNPDGFERRQRANAHHVRDQTPTLSRHSSATECL